MTSFAGITYPQKIYKLPKPLGHEGIRKKRDMRKYCGPFYMENPRPIQGRHEGGFFFLNSDFQPGRYWKYADEVYTGIQHTGWFIDEQCDEKIRGIVIYLPHGKFLSGCTFGEGMISKYDGDIFTEEDSAAMAADESARIAAEHEREYRKTNEEDEVD